MRALALQSRLVSVGAGTGGADRGILSIDVSGGLVVRPLGRQQRLGRVGGLEQATVGVGASRGVNCVINQVRISSVGGPVGRQHRLGGRQGLLLAQGAGGGGAVEGGGGYLFVWVGCVRGRG